MLHARAVDRLLHFGERLLQHLVLEEVLDVVHGVVELPESRIRIPLGASQCPAQFTFLWKEANR